MFVVFYSYLSTIPENNELHFDGFMLSRSTQSSNYFENMEYIEIHIFYRNAHISGVSLTMRNRTFLSEIFWLSCLDILFMNSFMSVIEAANNSGSIFVIVFKGCVFVDRAERHDF